MLTIAPWAEQGVAKAAVDRLCHRLEEYRGTGKSIELAEEFRVMTLQVRLVSTLPSLLWRPLRPCAWRAWRAWWTYRARPLSLCMHGPCVELTALTG